MSGTGEDVPLISATREYCPVCARVIMVIMCAFGFLGVLMCLILLGSTGENWPLYFLFAMLLPLFGVFAIHISKRLGEK